MGVRPNKVSDTRLDERFELLPVSRTRSMGVIVKPEVAYGEAEFQS